MKKSVPKLRWLVIPTLICYLPLTIVAEVNAASMRAAPLFVITGHNGFFRSPDGTEDWLIYHANVGAGRGCGDARSTRMQKFTRNTDSTPNFGQPIPTGSTLPRPSEE